MAEAFRLLDLHTAECLEASALHVLRSFVASMPSMGMV